MTGSEHVAKRFHELYEQLAPTFGWRPRVESTKPWHELPGPMRRLMVAVVETLIATGVIHLGSPQNHES